MRLPRRNFHSIIMYIILLLLLRTTPTSSFSNQEQQPIEEFNITEISKLRAREIKRRLALHHGYSADEIARMIDKKDLIHALQFEEFKLIQKKQEDRKREYTIKGIIVALAAVLFVMFLPVFKHAWEIVCVNVVVYFDKKKYEISRCLQIRSMQGFFIMLVLIVIELLQIWLSTSVILSWVIPRNKYLFPTPYVPVRPGALLNPGSQSAATGLSRYGLNVGPMIITWILRYIHSKAEAWLRKVISKAQSKFRKETDEERKLRKAKKRAEKEERKRQRQQQKEKQKAFMEEIIAKEREEDEQQQQQSAASINETSEEQQEEYTASFEDLD